MTSVTVPETGEWIGADINASVSPIFCPTVTGSPFFTRHSQGAPMCWDIGITTLFGSGKSIVSQFFVPLL